VLSTSLNSAQNALSAARYLNEDMVRPHATRVSARPASSGSPSGSAAAGRAGIWGVATLGTPGPSGSLASVGALMDDARERRPAHGTVSRDPSCTAGSA
jgi:hypothetical protein